VPSEAQATPVERRLATILVADVAGYSRLIGENEERTLRVLRGHRALFDDILKTHRGRVFNTAGDAILAEFPSAVEAVRCATEVQSALRTRNEHVPEEERLWFRIGVNLGDVVVQDGDLLGDGVNVAARIQTVAEPGGICIAGSVYDQIQNKLTLSITQLGERTFKNIAQPIRTFAVSDGTSAAPRPGSRSLPSRAIIVVALVVGAATAGAFWWRDHAQREADAALAERQAQAEKEAKLASDLKAAKDALAAEEEKSRRAAAEREAKAASDLKTAKEAAAKTAAPAATKMPVESPASSVARFDGLYQGRVCKATPRGSAVRCWNALMSARNGVVTMSWSSRMLGNGEHGHGTVSSTGQVMVTVEVGDTAEQTLPGKLSGRIVDKAVTLAGTWNDGTAGNASLAWAPDVQQPTTARKTTKATDK
jgi:adenylate cyclase